MKFTKDYLESKVLRGGSTRMFSFATCRVIKQNYPDKLPQYQVMLKEQFNFDPHDPLDFAFVYVSDAELALLRVLLLQAFEQAILNGELK